MDCPVCGRPLADTSFRIPDLVPLQFESSFPNLEAVQMTTELIEVCSRDCVPTMAIWLILRRELRVGYRRETW
jgi:hypothetical protein